MVQGIFTQIHHLFLELMNEKRRNFGTAKDSLVYRAVKALFIQLDQLHRQEQLDSLLCLRKRDARIEEQGQFLDILRAHIENGQRLADRHVIPLAIVLLLALGQRLDGTREERGHLLEDRLLGCRRSRMREVHHQRKVAALLFVQAESRDKLGQHLGRKRLAPADQVQIESRRGIPRLLGEGPVRKVALHGLTVIVIILQILSVVVVSVYVHHF